MCPSKSTCPLTWCKLHQQPLSPRCLGGWHFAKVFTFLSKTCFGILEVTVKGGQEQIRCFCQTFALRLKFNGETKVMHVHVLQVRNHNNILYFHTLYFPQICHFDRFHSKGRKGSQKSIKLKTFANSHRTMSTPTKIDVSVNRICTILFPYCL